ncbi:DNA gyrase inhibitor YacG [Larsenimonas suaedae]|uniref:DNA gyrase inhibitor YacG n=1 Tax=Larsenimonas suaedae TaxID=1851019 RepID=A0ABU1GUN4_9GAMM|nr:DNA gyrase inhibitor YacG [Larsenimonas suaedae]MCM2971050.1 DNA gyrase inhibitor YacG [Larsenimonas suaedae]MDR5895759.1 DNA gyrase inhibitor YacG [Larsenimonas suaedae]
MSQTTNTPAINVHCPHCGTDVAWTAENTYRPFCSKRCRLIDLGAWANEDHRIAGEPAMDETNLEDWLDPNERF